MYIIALLHLMYFTNYINSDVVPYVNIKIFVNLNKTHEYCYPHMFCKILVFYK